MKAGRRVLVAAHGNSLRAMVKYLDGISDDEIVGLNIPTGVPLVYHLDENLKPLKSFYLGDAEAVKAKAEAVANQGKKGEGPQTIRSRIRAETRSITQTATAMRRTSVPTSPHSPRSTRGLRM